MILHAINQARRFIYLEDQYLVSMDVSAALVRALPRIQHLTIVIPHTNLLSSTECPQDFKSRRSAFIAPLVAAGGSKVRIFHLHPPGAPNTYVHSKMWVIDDEFAIIGSANCNRRSYTHDSEVTAGVYDPDRSFAKQLRMALWAKHLNMAPSALTDGVASARFWLSPPPGAHVAPFNHLAAVTTGNAPRCRLASWDTHIDPDGS
jgi:phosphatidylserine/phosphatidylglycerophosphate/cardiolipin synthase-like enzyme